LLGYLQRETELTRPPLAEILEKSNRLSEVTRNPQQSWNTPSTLSKGRWTT